MYVGVGVGVGVGGLEEWKDEGLALPLSYLH